MKTKHKAYKLNEVCKIFAGGDKPKIFNKVKSKYFNVPVYANGMLKEGLQGYTNEPKVYEPSVTVSARGTIGFAALRRVPYVPIVRLLTLIPNKDLIDLEYLYYYLTLYRQAGIGSSQPQLTVPDISNRSISVSSLISQQKTAKVLSDLDAKIELNNKIKYELKAMLQLIYDYWFVQFDFPDENGKPYKSSGGKMVYNEELKREIPEGWKIDILDNVVDAFTKGTTTSYLDKSDLINLNQKVNKGWSLERQYFKFLDPSKLIPEEKYAREKDILINSLGQGTLGRVHYFCENVGNIVVDQHLFILRTINSQLTPTYLFLTLDSSAYKKQIERQITGSTGMQMLNASNLKTIKILVPSKKILDKFESTVYSCFKKRVSCNSENQKLAEIRDWLLPILMNGQVKVNN